VAEVALSDITERGGWDGILAPGEKVEWQGKPVQGLRWELRSPRHTGLIVGATFALTLLAVMQPSAPFALGDMPLIILAWAALIIIGYHAWSCWNRYCTRYLVTNKRVFIDTRHFGHRRLEGFEIASQVIPRLIDGATGSVFIAQKWVTKWNRHSERYETVPVDFWFSDIRNARLVFDLLVRLGGRAE
jgi:hypothetical protein